jgi:hypothetical protein
MLQKIPLTDMSQLLHPRGYNIAWMTILEEAHATQADFESIY